MKEGTQPHLLEGIEGLSIEAKHLFLEQLSRCQGLPQGVPRSPLPREIAPLETAQDIASLEPCSDVHLAALVLAGGQGSRMGLTIPKGMVEHPSYPGQTLFQGILRKVSHAIQKAQRPLHLIIMTSPLNDSATRQYFADIKYGGLDPAYIHFFAQSMRPLLDDKGQWILAHPGQLLEGPDGNGYALHGLHRSGILSILKKEGVASLNVIPVDNPLADPFEMPGAAYQHAQGWEVMVKAVWKEDPSEKMGVLATYRDALRVVEYSEISDQHPVASGRLGNTGLLTFSYPFIERIVNDPSVILPWHTAHKEATTWRGRVAVQKQEAFIFDLLPYARSAGALLYPRHEIFDPLKLCTGQKMDGMNERGKMGSIRTTRL